MQKTTGLAGWAAIEFNPSATHCRRDWKGSAIHEAQPLESVLGNRKKVSFTQGSNLGLLGKVLPLFIFGKLLSLKKPNENKGNEISKNVASKLLNNNKM